MVGSYELEHFSLKLDFYKRFLQFPVNLHDRAGCDLCFPKGLVLIGKNSINNNTDFVCRYFHLILHINFRKRNDRKVLP